jgi:hypothetical protein
MPDNKQSRVDYKGFAADRTALKAVLAEWSGVSPAAFAAYSREQQQAFLINAYNGFTVELILTRYPDLKSIKDLGSLIQSPWKKKFFTLLGEERHLDWIEHEQLRPRYADPRVHAAVNCASIGCPALRPEAFTAARLDAQLDDGMLRFMADRTRNRFSNGRAEISAIFKWFREDFEKGHKGFRKLDDLLARYADQLADAPGERDRLRAGGWPSATWTTTGRSTTRAAEHRSQASGHQGFRACSRSASVAADNSPTRMLASAPLASKNSVVGSAFC